MMGSVQALCSGRMPNVAWVGQQAWGRDGGAAHPSRGTARPPQRCRIRAKCQVLHRPGGSRGIPARKLGLNPVPPAPSTLSLLLLLPLSQRGPGALRQPLGDHTLRGAALPWISEQGAG